MRAITAEAAIDEPEAAPKPAEARLVAMASPPGRRANQSRAASNRSLAIPEWFTNAPMSRNMGIAVSSQFAANW